MKKRGSEISVFGILNYLVLIMLAAICIAPMIYILAVSLSSSKGLARGGVIFFPRNFTLAAYEYCLNKNEFIQSLWMSVKRVAIGIPLNMILTILAAYPLSKSNAEFKGRTVYAWVFVFTMLCGAGLIPTYMVVYKVGLIDNILALILPGAVPVFNVILLLNFFRSIPKTLSEAAFLDGAGHWTCLFKVYLPMSYAALSTLVLFCFIAHWNAWFDGIIYMNSSANYPLQSYLQTLVIKTDLTSVSSNKAIANYDMLSNNNLKSAQIILGTLPLIILYPLIQKYFAQGITLGSVKE